MLLSTVVEVAFAPRSLWQLWQNQCPRVEYVPTVAVLHVEVVHVGGVVPCDRGRFGGDVRPNRPCERDVG